MIDWYARRKPEACPVCGVQRKQVRRHMKRMHRGAILAWDDEFGWTFIYG